MCFFLFFRGRWRKEGGWRGERASTSERGKVHGRRHIAQSQIYPPPPLTSKTTTTTTTLTEETTWRLRLLLKDVTTTNGRKLDGGASLFVLEGKFVEEMGYEPPQGYFQPTTTTMRTAMMEEGGLGVVNIKLK